MAFDLLLREGRMNTMGLRNRLITGPMEKGMANRDGSLSQHYIDYLTERARGGASLLMVESCHHCTNLLEVRKSGLNAICATRPDRAVPVRARARRLTPAALFGWSPGCA